MRCANHPDAWAVFTADMACPDPPYRAAVPVCGPCGYRLKVMGYELTEVANKPLEPQGESSRVIAGNVLSVSFRLETILQDDPGFRPEDLVGLVTELHWPNNGGMLRGKVIEVEPYVDAELGPGHWITMEAPRGA